MPPYNSTDAIAAGSLFQNSNKGPNPTQMTVHRIIYCPGTDMTYKGQVLSTTESTRLQILPKAKTPSLADQVAKPEKILYIKHGKGFLHDHSSGMTLEGYFQNNQVIGHALQTLYDPSGRHIVAQYEGSFVLEETYIRHGKGKYTWQTTNDVYSGDFYMGMMQGVGTFLWGTGDRYEGPFKNGLMHGPKGKKFIQATGDIFEGSFRKGRIHGWGTKTFGNGDIFCGMYSRDLRQGFGRYSWSNGDTYSGKWVDGSITGRGVKSLVLQSQRRNSFSVDDTNANTDLMLGQGDTYECYSGEWIHGVPQGSGIKHYARGDYHLGQYLNGNRHGYGVYTWCNGDVYEGDFRHGSCAGHGFKLMSIGDTYDGEWFEDKANGYGVKTFSNGDIHMGLYKNDERHGFGLMIWANGDQYEGDFACGELSGVGTYTWSNSVSYCGQWLNGKKNGAGYLKYHMNGVSADFFEVWVRGKRVLRQPMDMTLKSLPSAEGMRYKKLCLDELLRHYNS